MRSWLKRTKECKVSVIVPVYRVGNYINRCMKSLLKQTLKEIEIICVCEEEDDAFEWGEAVWVRRKFR